MSGYRITDPFFKQLHKRLSEELDKRTHAIASGNSLTHGSNGVLSVEATAMRYNSDVSYVQALVDILEMGVSIDKEIYGSQKPVDGDD